jgi:hypothetical protein
VSFIGVIYGYTGIRTRRPFFLTVGRIVDSTSDGEGSSVGIMGISNTASRHARAEDVAKNAGLQLWDIMARMLHIARGE